MNVDGKMVAIVGPNESGKSSFLHALAHLSHQNPFTTTGGSQEITRNESVPDNQQIVKLTYLLEDADREALSGVHGADQIRWFTVAKTVAGGAFPSQAIPAPRRSLEPRQEAVQALRESPLRSELDEVELPE